MKKDLTGQRFGRLVVIGEEAEPYIPPVGVKTRRWKCRCDCGREVVHSRKDLLSGKITSCGCPLREESRKTVAEKVGQVDGTNLSATSPNRKPDKNNKSGVKGVYYSKIEKCWIAKIGVKRKTITIGRFCSREDAAEARKKAEEKYFVPILKEHKK